MFTLEEANEFLLKIPKIPAKLKPNFHFIAKHGWINDPYGIIFYEGEYHVFYQYHPFSAINGDMSWGHLVTKDFVSFKEKKVAIAPDKFYDNTGCWSGSALVKDNKIYLFYTGFSKHDDGKFYQTINLAISEDGENFVKPDFNPIIDTKDIYQEANIYDFRDPCVYIKDDKINLIIGTKNDKEAMLVVYESENLKDFKFKQVLFKDNKFGTMFECPNLVNFENSSYIIMSPQNVKPDGCNFFNVSSSVYTKIGQDFNENEQKIEKITEIDHGFEFYAPTISDDLKISVSWLQMWGRRYYLNEIGAPFINSLSLFKDVKLIDDRISFIPRMEYDAHFDLKTVFDGEIKENETLNFDFGPSYRSKIHLELKDHNIVELELTKNKQESVKLIVSKLENRIYIDRKSLKEQLYGVDHTSSTLGLRYLDIDLSDSYLDLDIFVDKWIIEVFLNDYKDSFSSLSFSFGKTFSIKTYLPIHVEIKESEFKK